MVEVEAEAEARGVKDEGRCIDWLFGGTMRGARSAGVPSSDLQQFSLQQLQHSMPHLQRHLINKTPAAADIASLDWSLAVLLGQQKYL